MSDLPVKMLFPGLKLAGCGRAVHRRCTSWILYCSCFCWHYSLCCLLVQFSVKVFSRPYLVKDFVSNKMLRNLWSDLECFSLYHIFASVLSVMAA